MNFKKLIAIVVISMLTVVPIYSCKSEVHDEINDKVKTYSDGQNIRSASETEINYEQAKEIFDKRDFDSSKLSAEKTNTGMYKPVSYIEQGDETFYAEYSNWHVSPSGVTWLVLLTDGKISATPFAEELENSITFTEDDILTHYNAEDNTYIDYNLNELSSVAVNMEKVDASLLDGLDIDEVKSISTLKPNTDYNKNETGE